ncbi:MAG TPA: hypothetical protein VD972_25215, partial [Hyalangium sp.]|nr:hypothetical protein [Hyalangium sp.]
ISQAMHPHLFVPQRPPAVLIAELGELSGAIGAALLAGPTAETAQRRSPRVSKGEDRRGGTHSD